MFMGPYILVYNDHINLHLVGIYMIIEISPSPSLTATRAADNPAQRTGQLSDNSLDLTFGKYLVLGLARTRR